MSHKIIISIIVPVYNVEMYLEKCIESILGQTFENFELILVDDGSSDNSAIICDEYSKKDKRIKVIHKENGGLSSARNIGLDLAKGEYIGFVDSDDFISPNMFNELYNMIIKNNYDLAICNFLPVKQGELVFNTYIESNSVEEFEGSEILNQLYGPQNVQFVVAWNKLYKKELFNELRYEVGKLCEDEYIIHRILYKCKKVIYSSEIMYYYTQRENSIMSTVSAKRIIDVSEALEDRINFFKEMKCFSLYQKAVNTYVHFVILECRKASDSKIKLVLSSSIRKWIYVMLKGNHFSLKEKLAIIVLAINHKLYDKLFKY